MEIARAKSVGITTTWTPLDGLSPTSHVGNAGSTPAGVNFFDEMIRKSRTTKPNIAASMRTNRASPSDWMRFSVATGFKPRCDIFLRTTGPQTRICRLQGRSNASIRTKAPKPFFKDRYRVIMLSS
jgi:hypothetical protein